MTTPCTMATIHLHQLSHTISEEVEDKCNLHTRVVPLIQVSLVEAELNIQDVLYPLKQIEFQARKIIGTIEQNQVDVEMPTISMKIVRRMSWRTWIMDTNMGKKSIITTMKMTHIDIMLKSLVDNRCTVNHNSSLNIITMTTVRLIGQDKQAVIKRTFHLLLIIQT